MLALIVALCLMHFAVQAEEAVLKKDTIVCAGQQVAFTLTTDLSGSVEYRLYKVVETDSTLVGTPDTNSNGSAAFYITPQGIAVEKYVGKACPNGVSCIVSNAIRMVVVPPPTAGKIDHSKNTP